MDSLVSNASRFAREGLVTLGVRAVRILDAARSEEARALDSFLRRVGLQRRESAWRPVWFFAAGAVVAGAAVLVLRPAFRKALAERVGVLSKAIDGSDAVTTDPNTSGPSKPANGAVAQAVR